MNRKAIAVLFGGCSPEYPVSLESACAVIGGMDRKKYRPVPVGITRTGKWFFFGGAYEKIRDDTWHQAEDCVPALLSPNRGDKRLLLLRETGVESMELDAVFPVLHGQNGEDGTVQGLIELAGIPLVGCGTLASALCMDKDRAHRLAAAAGVSVPRSALIEAGTEGEKMEALAAEIGYPLFVKPVRAGSSFGVTRVPGAARLRAAVELALQYDRQVILEEAIEGVEVGCAVMGKHCLTVGEVDEIELSGGFFDFVEKYTLKTSAIHVPARLSSPKAEEVKETAKCLYRALDCSGFARVDLFLTPQGRLVFNEINTIPGFTEHSRFPGMMKAAGLPFGELLSRMIEETMEP